MSKQILEKTSNLKLPQGWIWGKIQDLVLSPKNDIVDGPFGSNLKSSEYINKGIPIIRLQNIDRNKFIKKNIKYISKQKAEQLKRHNFLENDIVITKLGDPLGKACLMPEYFDEGIIVADIIRCRLVHDYISKKFLTYLINSEVVINQFKNQTRGTTRPRTSLTKFREFHIPIPPLGEQKRIVSKLDELFSKSNDVIQNINFLKNQIKLYEKSILQNVIIGKLTQEWRLDNVTSPLENLLKEIRNSKNKGMDKKLLKEEPNDIKKLPNLPENWKWIRLGFLSKVITKGSSPRWQGIKYTNQGILFITSENVGYGKLNLTEMKFLEIKFNEIQKRSILKKGDLLTNIVGASIGRSAIFNLDQKTNINQAVSLIRVENNINKKYILLVLNSPLILNQMHQAKVDVARANLSLQDVADFPIPLPSLEEQIKIVEYMEDSNSIIIKVDKILNLQIKQIIQLNNSILKQAFEGKLVSQDPNDKSAEILLQKIKQEKEQLKLKEKKPRRKKNAR